MTIGIGGKVLSRYKLRVLLFDISENRMYIPGRVDSWNIREVGSSIHKCLSGIKTIFQNEIGPYIADLSDVDQGAS